MTIYRHPVHRDANHFPVLRGIEAGGGDVMDTSGVGDRWPDMIVGVHGYTWLVEVKSGKKVHHKKGNGETEGQAEKRKAWRGGEWIVVETAAEFWRAEERRMRSSTRLLVGTVAA